MSCEVKLNTLQGNVITLDVVTPAIVRELKAMLLEKHPCQDPIERKVLKVELLRESSIINDAESLDEAGLMGAEPLVTVAYTRNESRSCNEKWHPHTGMFWGEDPLQPETNFPISFPKLPSTSFGHNPWVCDSHSGVCLSKLHLFGEHHLGWVCDTHWELCLSKLHLFGEHCFGWVCDSHWGECVWRLHLFGEHYFGWVCDTHWELCLWWVHLFGEHHNSRVIETHFEESVVDMERFSGSHHHSCKAGQETTPAGLSAWVSECTELFQCQWPTDWCTYRKTCFCSVPVALWWVASSV